MLNKLKIMLGVATEADEDCKEPDGPYDSFLKDLQSQTNSGRPQFDDHEMALKLVRLLRGDEDPEGKTVSEVGGPDKVVGEGILNKLRRKLSE